MHLNDPLIQHFRLQEAQRRALKRLGITAIRDILFHFPSRYENPGENKLIEELALGEQATVYGTLSSLKTRKAWKSKMPIAEAQLTDQSGKIKVMWFNQPYLAKMVESGKPVGLSGKVGGKPGQLYLANPEVKDVADIPDHSHAQLFKKDSGGYEPHLHPVYPESRGVTSKWLYHAILKLHTNGIFDEIQDPVPEEILQRYHLPTLKTALTWIHMPRHERDSAAARKRLAFDEVFAIQIAKQRDRREYRSSSAFEIKSDSKDVAGFMSRFPFEPTQAQHRAIQTILKDFQKQHPMSRLLEGDVGSGKTAVAATTAYAAVTSRPNGQDFGNLQVAYMAPTEILAKQHFESFIEYFAHLPVQIGLITGSGCKKFPSKVNPTQATDISRAQLLKWVANGEIPILIGTHALIQKTVRFKHLAYAIIDEQHRYGTKQRMNLIRKDTTTPHLLSMTATPIPRTLALTIYGDLDLTLLDEMPAGRKPIITEIIPKEKREETYAHIRKELENGRQVYVICPRISEPDPTKEQALNVKSVKEEARRLKKDVFPEYEIDILHSKLRPKEKDEVMEQFLQKEIDVLVATSVVEVGVNVPNATVIVIEGAERFGLAQLHQLRGRVLRSAHQAYCYVFPDTASKKSFERLRALTAAKNGFELAEKDLALRGSGELYGARQWGLSDIAMDAIKNIKMVEAARAEAEKIVAEDPDLSKHPLLKETAERKKETLHFE